MMMRLTEAFHSISELFGSGFSAEIFLWKNLQQPSHKSLIGLRKAIVKPNYRIFLPHDTCKVGRAAYTEADVGAHLNGLGRGACGPPAPLQLPVVIRVQFVDE